MHSNYYNRLTFLMEPEKYMYTQLMNSSMSPYMQTNAVRNREQEIKVKKQQELRKYVYKTQKKTIRYLMQL